MITRVQTIDKASRDAVNLDQRILKQTKQHLKNNRMVIVAAPYYPQIVGPMIDSAKQVIAEVGLIPFVLEVPGALEIPAAIAMVAADYDGFVALGCVIRGETSHYEVVTEQSARALMDMMIGPHPMAIGNGILTVNNIDQAYQRSLPDFGNKGREAAIAAMSLMLIAQGLR